MNNRMYSAAAGCGALPAMPQPIIPGYVNEGICEGMNVEHELAGKRIGYVYGFGAGIGLMLGLKLLKNLLGGK
ncbi:MAG: hypothetical protein JRD89_02340 [Deltaproteobacteria bacterium]|nr:hypothetical protein [Deltaproteobacteria bacterium]